jgi:uncharacterized membrane protein YhhN
MRGTVLLRFIPFAVVGVLHLVTLFIDWDAGSTVTKLGLMPALLLAFVWALPVRRGAVLVIGAIAIVLSWLGDALLDTPGDLGFLLGLGSFLLAHVAYLVLFAGPMRRSSVPWPALAYAAWWLALVAILAPYIGGLLVPVAAYGLVIALAAAAALGTNRFAAIGALLFLISDTILAFRLFYPDFEFWQMNFTIMVFYIAGQGLIALGAIAHVQSLAVVSPESTAQESLAR